MNINIHITVDAPTGWKRRVLLYVATPLALVAITGIAAYAYDTAWIADGQAVSAAQLKANLDEAQTRIAALEAITTANPACPLGYTQDALATGITLCKKGADEVVKVGTGASAFWIDRYEASISQNADGSGTQYGLAAAADYPATFPGNGQYTTPVYALSIAGKQPSAWMTWFQAQQACRLSGKRLPSGEEWLAAATGTPDPGAHAAAGGFCDTQGASPQKTGAGTVCASRWGAQDMIGSLWEWTAEWYASPGNASTPAGTWPDPAYSGDGTLSIASSAYAGYAGWTAGLPAAALRGGDLGTATGAGVFALNLANAPSTWNVIGFRCVVPGK